MDLQRPEKSAAEIAALPDLSAPELGEHLATYGPGLSPETLVYLLRELSCSGDEHHFRQCAEFLIGVNRRDGSVAGGFCEGTIRSLAAHYGFRDPDLLREYRAGCYERLWREIHAGHAKSKHLEERFGRAFKARAIDVARSVARRRRKERDLVPLPEEDGGSEIQEKKALDDGVIAKLGETLLLEGLRQLPPKQARVGYLAWVEGYLVESENPDEITVSSVMHISGRMVRKHLSLAREALRSDPSIQAILEDDGRV